MIERSLFEVRVGHRKLKQVAELAQLLDPELLLLVRDVHALEAFTECPTLDGVRENDGWAAPLLGSPVIRGKNLLISNDPLNDDTVGVGAAGIYSYSISHEAISGKPRA